MDPRSKAKTRDVKPDTPTTISFFTTNNPELQRARSLSSSLYEQSQQSFLNALNRGDRSNRSSVQYSHGPTERGSTVYNDDLNVRKVQRAVSVPCRSYRLDNANQEYRIEIVQDNVSSSYPGVVLVSIKPQQEVEEEQQEEEEEEEGEEEDEMEFEEEIVPEPQITTKKKSKKARHWVDEITVSSGPVVHGEAEQPQPAEQDENNMDEGSDESSEPVLPGYVCPSSEDKSREFAIRSWLKNTSFNACVKTVPIL